MFYSYQPVYMDLYKVHHSNWPEIAEPKPQREGPPSKLLQQLLANNKTTTHNDS